MTDRLPLLQREGVGATAQIIQATEARFRHLHINTPALVLVRSGAKWMTNGSQSLEVSAGEAVAISAGQAVDIENRTDGNAPYRAEVIAFDGEALRQANAQMQSASGDKMKLQSYRPAEAFEEALIRVKESLSEPAAIPLAVARHRIAELLIWLGDSGIAFQVPAAETLPQKIRSLISSDLCRTWLSPEIARSFAMSEASMRRQLAAADTSLSQILIDVRLSRALELLQMTDLSVTQIALETGYASPSRFAARFRARFGLSPREIRVKGTKNERIGTDIERNGAAISAQKT